MTPPGNVYLTFEQVQALLAAARPVAEAAPALVPAPTPAAPPKSFESMSSAELGEAAGAYYRTRLAEAAARRQTFQA
ncbi:MAG TPA: hypothetical protein VGX23_33720 [Actinocrinis sp.]|nr:hypothetical protein [Actinocrinis sp.]